MTRQDIRQIDAEIRRLTGECPVSRPFLCDGSPLGCDVALVGINPATDTPFWPYWSAPSGFDRAGWIGDYRCRHAGRRTPTRDRIELLVNAIKPFRLLELNLFQYPSRSERELERSRRDARLFEYLLQATLPRLLIAHGLSTKQHLEKLLNCKLAYDQIMQCSFNGATIYVLQLPKHLAYVPGGEGYVHTLATRIRSRLTSGLSEDNPPRVESVLSTKPVERYRGEGDAEEDAAVATLRRLPKDIRLRTAGGKGGTFTVSLRDAGRGMSIEFLRDSGGTKSMSASRFVQFWQMWLGGNRDLSAYRNQSGLRTRAAAASYALPVFEWIASQQRQSLNGSDSSRHRP